MPASGFVERTPHPNMLGSRISARSATAICDPKRIRWRPCHCLRLTSEMRRLDCISESPCLADLTREHALPTDTHVRMERWSSLCRRVAGAFFNLSSVVSSGNPQMKRLSEGSGPPFANLLLADANAAAAAAAALVPADGEVPPPPTETVAVELELNMDPPSSPITVTREAAGLPEEELLVESSNCTRAP